MFALLLNVYVNMNIFTENGCKYNMKYKQLQELKDFLSFINILIAFCFYSVMIIFNANYHELIKKFFTKQKPTQKMRFLMKIFFEMDGFSSIIRMFAVERQNVPSSWMVSLGLSSAKTLYEHHFAYLKT